MKTHTGFSTSHARSLFWVLFFTTIVIYYPLVVGATDSILWIDIGREGLIVALLALAAIWMWLEPNLIRQSNSARFAWATIVLTVVTCSFACQYIIDIYDIGHWILSGIIAIVVVALYSIISFAGGK